MAAIRVLLVEDHKLVREGTRQLLQQADDLEVVGEAADGEEAVRLAGQHSPDVILMDVHLPRLSGIEATRAIKACRPEVSIVILSAYDDDRYVFPLMDAGANGYLLKTSSGAELAEAIRNVHEGQMVLSPSVTSKVFSRLSRRRPQAGRPQEEKPTERELEVLREVARGRTNREIGDILAISPQTVQAHLRNIYSKLHMSSRAEAAAYAVCRGWITLEQHRE